MKKKTILTKTLLVSSLFLLSLNSISGYNGKYQFKLTSGWLSPWVYSNGAYKVTKNESPVVGVTKTTGQGATSEFEYTVVNSNNEHRVTQFRRQGTFAIRRFGRNILVQDHKYWLGIKRTQGAWNSSAQTEGMWNPDEY